MNRKMVLPCTIGALLGVAILSLPVLAPPPSSDNRPVPKNGNGNGGGDDDGSDMNDRGRLSPASLDVDTCGCPTTFGPPVCEERTSWTLDKVSDTGDLDDPDPLTSFSFTITVTEGPTTKNLTGGGTLIVTNSGEQTVVLESVVVLLESIHDCPGPGGGPGPSGNNWRVEAEATQARNCADDLAVTCYGNFQTSAGASLVLIDPDTNDAIALADLPAVAPSLDDDGDGLRDEDPPNTGINDTANACDIMDNDGDGLIDEDGPDDDGDGLVDEDGPCDDSALILNFVYVFDLAGVESCDGDVIGESDGIPDTGDEWRIDLLVTFVAGGRRGGTCTVDADCDGTDETDVRTIQQRLEFELTECTRVCECVQLTDPGAEAKDPTCVLVLTTTLDEEICATGVAGTQTVFQITGTVTCIDKDCGTTVNNTAELTCEDPDLIEGSPNGASFDVTCEGPPQPDGFCTQTQGGWGSTPSGNNPGACLHDHFAAVFPSGLVIGDSDGRDGDDCYALKFTTAQAITDFLPAGGTPAPLSCSPEPGCSADAIDPLTSSAGVFAGQLVAATINVAFSASSETCPGRDFPSGLGDLVFKEGCVADTLVGKSVNEVIAIANCAIGSNSGACGDCGGVTTSELSDALATLNENFVDCDADNGCLDPPPGAVPQQDPGTGTGVGGR